MTLSKMKTVDALEGKPFYNVVVIISSKNKARVGLTLNGFS